MDKKKIILLILLGFVFIIGFLQLKKLSAPKVVVAPSTEAVAEVVPQQEYAHVLVALGDIARGDRITTDSLEWKKWPVDALSEGLIDEDSRPTALEDTVGAVAKGLIVTGEPISDRKIIHTGDRSQMAALLKPGMRAISVEINTNSAAGGFILPGDQVDIVLSTQVHNQYNEISTGSNQPTYVATTIFSNVHVMAVDQIYGQAPDGTASIIGATATLELSQSDAEIIIEAQSAGEISLTLRGINNRDARYVPSAATTIKKDAPTVTSMTLYRNGQPQVVAIQGH